MFLLVITFGDSGATGTLLKTIVPFPGHFSISLRLLTSALLSKSAAVDIVFQGEDLLCGEQASYLVDIIQDIIFDVIINHGITKFFFAHILPTESFVNLLTNIYT